MERGEGKVRLVVYMLMRTILRGHIDFLVNLCFGNERCGRPKRKEKSLYGTKFSLAFIFQSQLWPKTLHLWQ